MLTMPSPDVTVSENSVRLPVLFESMTAGARIDAVPITLPETAAGPAEEMAATIGKATKTAKIIANSLGVPVIKQLHYLFRFD